VLAILAKCCFPPSKVHLSTASCRKGTSLTLASHHSIGGQLILMVKSKRADACYEVTKQVLQALGANVASSEYTQGFGYMGQPPYGGRDLTGCAPLAQL
jgi:hypothetical protein